MKEQSHKLRNSIRDLKTIAVEMEAHECDEKLMVFDYSVDGNKELSQHFTLSEFRSKDGAETVVVDKRLIEKLQIMRYKIERPIIIISGFRTPDHNRKVKGARESEHRNGTAADIKVAGFTGNDLARLAREVGFTGIGIGADMCHVDVRDEPAEWRY